jgi:hypothetical protein
VEGGQHEAALESLAGDHILRYLYDEFDDGKDVLVKTSHDMWQDVKSRVDIDSRRWFPQSAETFGKELNRIKQALEHKGFEISRGSVGTGNERRRAIKVARIDDGGSVRVSSGSVENDLTDPADMTIDKPKSARLGGAGSVGSVDSAPFSISKNKKKGRRRKSFRKRTDPTDPHTKKGEESGVDKPNGAGSVPPKQLTHN